jgi:hypothetical protein
MVYYEILLHCKLQYDALWDTNLWSTLNNFYLKVSLRVVPINLSASLTETSASVLARYCLYKCKVHYSYQMRNLTCNCTMRRIHWPIFITLMIIGEYWISDLLNVFIQIGWVGLFLGYCILSLSDLLEEAAWWVNCIGGLCCFVR